MRIIGSHQLLLPVLVLAGFVIRCLHLGRADLWTDEILFVWLSAPPMNPWDVVVNQWKQLLVITHLPLPEVIQNITLWIARGFVDDVTRSPMINRLPAVICGVLTIPAFHRLASRVLVDSPRVITATLMITFFTFPVYYSREAYYYGPLMLFSTLLLSSVAKALTDRQLNLRDGFILVLFGICVVYSHMSGIAFCLVCIVMLSAYRACAVNVDRTGKKVLTNLALISILPLLAVSPWLLRLTTNKIQANTGRPEFSIGMLFFDAIGKMFMGSQLAWNVAAVALFILGVYALVQPGERAGLRRSMAGTLLMGALILGFGSHSTQYHVRYFSVLTPLVYLALSAGIYQASRLLARKHAAKLASLAIGLLLVVQLFVYLPSLIRLEAKSVDFGRIAEWVNGHVPEGGAFLLESAYELRFVSGYHTTPERVGAAPYVHGDLNKLHDRQKAFIRQFPETPWIESARHNLDNETGLGGWTWPHEHFQRRHDLGNEPLARMSRLGIHLSPGRHAPVAELWTPIWFNAPEDIMAIAQNGGQAVLFQYPGWSIRGRQVAPDATDYFRMAPGSGSVIKILNVNESPVMVDLALTMAILSDAPRETVSLQFDQMAPVNYTLVPDQFVEVPFNKLGLINREGELVIRHRNNGVKALLIRDIQYSQNR